MHDTMTLAELRARGLRLRADEAVGLAQQLMSGAAESNGAHPPYGLLSEDTVAIAEDGGVYCSGSAVTPSVAEIAILLQDLLDEPETPVPGGLKYAIGRALLEVEAPPFDSIQELSAALQRFEKEPARAVTAALYARAQSQTSSPAPDVVQSQYRGTERRRRMPSSTELRRQLRDTDKRLYEASRPGVLVRGGRRRPPNGPAPFTAGIVACGAMIAASGLGYTGGLAYMRMTGDHGTTRANPKAAIRQETRPADATVDPISATPLTTTVIPLPRAREPRAVQAAAHEHDRHSVRVARVAVQQDREDADRQQHARQPPQPSRNDDRGVLLRLRFEWDNPFKRSH